MTSDARNVPRTRQRRALVTAGQVVAIDGKSARRSHDRAKGQEALHMVTAWATANHLVLGQTKVAGIWLSRAWLWGLSQGSSRWNWSYSGFCSR